MLKTRLPVILLLCSAALLFAQLDVADRNYLESTSYYITADTGQSDTTANLIFKFRGNAGKYQYMLSKDSLVVDFYGAYFDQNTVQGKVGLPFEGMQVNVVKERMRSIENLDQSMMDVLRISYPLMKGAKPSVSTSSLRQVVTVNLSWLKEGAAPAEDEEYTSSALKYLLIAGTAILAVSVIVYVIQSTSKTHTDVVEVK